MILFITDEGVSFRSGKSAKAGTSKPKHTLKLWELHELFGEEQSQKINCFCLQSIKKTQKQSPHLQTCTLVLHTLKNKKRCTHIALWVHYTQKQLFMLSPFSSAFSFQTAPPSGPLSPCPWIGPASWHVSCEHKTRERARETLKFNVQHLE